MRLRSLAFVPLLAATAFALNCGGSAAVGVGPDGGTGTEGGPGDEAGDGGPGSDNPEAKGSTTAKKVDVLFVVDNSASMGDKAELLATSAGTLIRKIAPTGDMHIGIISTSLGSFGGDTCASTGPSGGRAHFHTKAKDGTPVPAAAQGFLSYSGGDLEALVQDTKTIVTGVDQNGCGFEAQLETMYRFLSAPDPWQDVKLDASNQATYQGVDEELLKQRAAFLRPDSLVVVVMLTDEDDSSADPLSVGGQGWAFMANQFPGSTMFRADGRTTTAPRATSVCQANPGSPDCTSCGFAATCNAADEACQKIKADPECQKNGGYYGPAEDQLNVRFHRMKERYGIDPQYPLSRYVDALTRVRVPSRADEHEDTPRGVGGGRNVGPYRTGTASCTNPLFAASLPKAIGDEMCKLPVGPRGKELVVFALIGGVGEQLLANGAPTSWDAVLGRDPGAFDYTGIDPHMIQSTVPRPGLPAPSSVRGDNGTDPMHGREWTTNQDDLQYACTFALPVPRTCTAQDPSCDCASSKNPPLCGASTGQQIKGKAYPTVRELRVARELGDRAIVASICPGNTAGGYESTMNVLADRLAPRLVK